MYQLGKLGFEPFAVGVMLGIDDAEIESLMADRGSEFYKSYYRGFYETEVQLRNSILKMAKAGSSPAQTMANNMLKAAKRTM